MVITRQWVLAKIIASIAHTQTAQTASYFILLIFVDSEHWLVSLSKSNPIVHNIPCTNLDTQILSTLFYALFLEKKSSTQDTWRSIICIV